MTKPQRATPHARGQFQSTPSVWRETVFSVFYGKILPFQSTPSVWRETQRATAQCLTVLISIHSLRVEGDESIDIKTDAENDFNPLPPCGGRRPILFKLLSKIYFNPLPPCGGRHVPTSLATLEKISIHSLRVEGDRRKPCSLYCLLYFNPLPPCGGRPCCGSAMWNFCSISIHSLRVEGDAVSGEDGSFTFEFQSTPSVWRETTSIITSSATNPFQSTPSVWRETWKFVRDMMKT